MDAIIMAVDPVLLSIGPVTIRWYGLMIAVGIALGVYVALREAKRLHVHEDAIFNCALWGVLGAIVGARGFHVIDRIDFYIQNPAAILAFQQGGLAIWGGLIGGVTAGAIYCFVTGQPVDRMADIAAPGLLLGQLIGRLGCLINGDAYGGPAELPWSITYVHPDALMPDLGIPTHPYPLYEIIWNALVLGALWRLRRAGLPNGALFLMYLVLYSIGRFALTFVRQEALLVFGLQQAQFLALVIILVALPMLWSRYRTMSLIPPATGG